jgi:hypothetical protein
VWAFVLSFVFVSLSALLIPTYVLYSTQFSAVQNVNETMNDSETNFLNAEHEVKKTNMLALQLLRPIATGSIADTLAALKNAEGSDVAIESFSIAREGADIKTITVQGNANSREALSTFATALERSPLLESAVVPIEDLARERDLPFAITITPTSHPTP